MVPARRESRSSSSSDMAEQSRCCCGQGKLAIHEIFEEGSLVSYWEKFGTIAFDQSQKAMLTSCILKNPDPASKVSVLHCCFSFTIRRDHNMWVVFLVLRLARFPSIKFGLYSSSDHV